jgi:hypothetical protein
MTTSSKFYIEATALNTTGALQVTSSGSARSSVLLPTATMAVVIDPGPITVVRLLHSLLNPHTQWC